MKPRILIIGPTPPPYFGVAVNTKALLEHPAIRGRFDVLHLDTSDRRDVTNVGKLDLVNVALAARHGVELLAKLLWHRPHLVYLPISPSYLGLIRDLEFLLPAAARGTVLVIHQRGGQMQELLRASNAALRATVRWVFERTARVIVLGDHFRPDFHGLVADDQIVVVHNGVDPAPYLSWRGARRADGTIRVLYMGILIESKGYRHVLEAARRLRGSRIVFELAGDFMSRDERGFAEGFVRDHDLHDSVRFLGVVSGAAKIDTLCGADIFAFPTAYPYEGHPTVIIEAMAAGLPIISTNHVAIPETMTHGEEGFLIEPGDVAALTVAIQTLASDAALRARMGARSRETLLRRFTLDHCVERIADVFAAALGGIA